MDVLGDLVARPRRGPDPALTAPAMDREYDYRRFCTTAWKASHLLRHLGVRSGRGVALAGAAPEAVLSLYGAASLGAPVTFDPPTDRPVEARALVAPAGRLDRYEVGPGTKRVGYGDAPADPDAAYFERDAWSENPTEPPDRVAPDDVLLRTGDGETYTHAAVLDAARRVAAEWDLAAADRVAVRAPLSHPGAVAAGLVAPLFVGGSILLPDGAASGGEGAPGTTGTAAVAVGDAPEERVTSPDAVFG